MCGCRHCVHVSVCCLFCSVTACQNTVLFKICFSVQRMPECEADLFALCFTFLLSVANPIDFYAIKYPWNVVILHFFLQSDKITSSVLFIRVFRRLCPFVLCRAGSRWLATLATVALRWWSGERHRDETRQSEHAYGHILWTVVEIRPESFAKNFTFHSPAALNNFDTSSSGL